MPTDPDVARIAEGLTKAQAAFVMSLPPNGEWRETTPEELSAHGPNALRGFGKSGLVEGYYHDPMQHRLTKIGQRVAHLLASQTSGEGDRG